MNHSPPFTNLKKSRSSFHWLRTSNRAVPGIWVMQLAPTSHGGPQLGVQPHSQPFTPKIICYNIMVDNNRKFYILSFYCISGLTHDVGCMDLQRHLNMKNIRKNSCHQHPTRICGTPLSYTVKHIWHKQTACRCWTQTQLSLKRSTYYSQISYNPSVQYRPPQRSRIVPREAKGYYTSNAMNLTKKWSHR